MKIEGWEIFFKQLGYGVRWKKLEKQMSWEPTKKGPHLWSKPVKDLFYHILDQNFLSSLKRWEHIIQVFSWVISEYQDGQFSEEKASEILLHAIRNQSEKYGNTNVKIPYTTRIMPSADDFTPEVWKRFAALKCLPEDCYGQLPITWALAKLIREKKVEFWGIALMDSEIENALTFILELNLLDPLNKSIEKGEEESRELNVYEQTINVADVEICTSKFEYKEGGQWRKPETTEEKQAILTLLVLKDKNCTLNDCESLQSLILNKSKDLRGILGKHKESKNKSQQARELKDKTNKLLKKLGSTWRLHIEKKSGMKPLVLSQNCKI